MKVLLSIKPEYAEKIFNGSKKYEYRRVIFKRKVETIIVYASDPIQRVMGEFDVGEIHKKNIERLWEDTGNHSGTTKSLLVDYFKNRIEGYAIEIKKPRKYNSPLLLSDLMISTAPQSFIYLSNDPIKQIKKQSQISVQNSSLLPAMA